MLYGILRHKHGRKHLTQYATSLLALVAVMGVFVCPTAALAQETIFAVSPSPDFIDQLDLLAPSQLIPEIGKPIPAHGYTSAAVLSAPSPITTNGAWKATTPAKVAVAPKVHPTLDTPVVLEGEASYYSRAGCLGCDPQMIMANGQPLNDNALTMAIGADKKHLVGYQAKVTSLATGKSVVVRITDTGGFYQAKYGHRVADLSVASKKAIWPEGWGKGQVRVEVF
ncbi:MAG: hypothetical protein HYZ63_03990 [Candidatus Andersenbacteria bacterium]|nr:hypothetical protein [Candidatus Andersenbacteria bacterium]